MRILIAGGTGTAGQVLARRAHTAGHLVRVLSRHAAAESDLADPDLGPTQVPGDLTSGAGLDRAVEGMEAVVDLSNVSTPSYRKAAAFFTAGTKHLFAAEERAGVGQHLTVSIVGVDAFPLGYYRAKVAQEEAVLRESERTGVGATIARVAQFHDFARLALHSYRLRRLALIPAMHVQPVHLDDVADHLLALLVAGPAGRSAPQLTGPRPEELPDMVRRYARAIGDPVRVLALPLVGASRRANEARVLQPVDSRHGRVTFDDWLNELRP